jgi:hypothetical protein
MTTETPVERKERRKLEMCGAESISSRVFQLFLMFYNLSCELQKCTQLSGVCRGMKKREKKKKKRGRENESASCGQSLSSLFLSLSLSTLLFNLN